MYIDSHLWVQFFKVANTSQIVEPAADFAAEREAVLAVLEELRLKVKAAKAFKHLKKALITLGAFAYDASTYRFFIGETQPLVDFFKAMDTLEVGELPWDFDKAKEAIDACLVSLFTKLAKAKDEKKATKALQNIAAHTVGLIDTGEY
jgi:hypothetical protein